MTAPPALRLRLPATSANLGPGFDALGLAMDFALTIEAQPAAEFSIEASGRDAELCARVDHNLIFDTYRDVLRGASPAQEVQPLHLRLRNEIPLGMGCGSSAAALLGGVLLASHFGALGWSMQQCMEEACRREGHPDNVAACALGALTVSSMIERPGADAGVVAASLGRNVPWKLLLALPAAGLATEKARAMLPLQYSRADAVTNVQHTALLVAAFAQGRGGLLRTAMQDRIHQPYRMEACPLLARLLPLAAEPGILGVALSGAGPSVLVIAEPDASTARLSTCILDAAGELRPEVLETRVGAGASVDVLS